MCILKHIWVLFLLCDIYTLLCVKFILFCNYSFILQNNLNQTAFMNILNDRNPLHYFFLQKYVCFRHLVTSLLYFWLSHGFVCQHQWTSFSSSRFFLVLLVCIFHLAPLHGKGNAFYMCAFLTSFTFLLPLYVPVFHDKLARYSSLFLLLMVSSHLVLRTKWADLICSVLVCILSHKVSIDRTGPKCSRIQIYCIFPISWKLYYSN